MGKCASQNKLNTKLTMNYNYSIVKYLLSKPRTLFVRWISCLQWYFDVMLNSLFNIAFKLMLSRSKLSVQFLLKLWYIINSHFFAMLKRSFVNFCFSYLLEELSSVISRVRHKIRNQSTASCSRGLVCYLRSLKAERLHTRTAGHTGEYVNGVLKAFSQCTVSDSDTWLRVRESICYWLCSSVWVLGWCSFFEWTTLIQIPAASFLVNSLQQPSASRLLT